MTFYWDRNGEPLDDVLAWAALYETQRKVARTQVDHDVMVSTIWMGTNMGLGLGGDPPLIFETMVFGGPLHHQTWRWPTLTDAVAGHDMVAHLVHLYATGVLTE